MNATRLVARADVNKMSPRASQPDKSIGECGP